MENEGICIGRGNDGCGYRGGKSGDTCPRCGGMMLSQKSINYAEDAVAKWNHSARSGTPSTPTTSSQD